MKKLVIAAAVVALAFAAPSGATTPDPETHRSVISTAGLNLASAKDQRVLDLRILHAASALCETPSAADPLALKVFNRCRDAAIASADAQRRSRVATATSRAATTIASAR